MDYTAQREIAWSDSMLNEESGRAIQVNSEDFTKCGFPGVPYLLPFLHTFGIAGEALEDRQDGRGHITLSGVRRLVWDYTRLDNCWTHPLGGTDRVVHALDSECVPFVRPAPVTS